MRSLVLVAALALAVAACSGDDSARPATTADPSADASAASATEAPPPARAALSQTGYEFPEAPTVPTGPAAAPLAADLDTLLSSLTTRVDLDAIARIGDSHDPRVAWLLSDLLRFIQVGETADALVAAFQNLTGANINGDPLSLRSPWQSVTNHLMAWDLPALPRYREWKRTPFEIIEPKWEPFFGDADADIDWRFLSWGGVRIDDRPLGTRTGCPNGCIPALDDPAVTGADEGNWYPDDSVVFGVVVDGEARAYPKNMMEVHEMINDTLGGRRIAIPYCTLCGSAQAYFTDDVSGRDEPLVLRTSGLLTRSNKVMYELTTFSVFDTFLGHAVSGPLQEEQVQLDQVSVVTSTWGDWKEAHPETTILARDGGIGRFYAADPLRGRDDAGPIFPIGDVDVRLPAQTQVLGVIAPDGRPVAFPAEMARAAIDAGEVVELAGVRVVADGGGVRAQTIDGENLVGHQAFWFAWSQFRPETVVWTPLG